MGVLRKNQQPLSREQAEQLGALPRVVWLFFGGCLLLGALGVFWIELHLPFRVLAYFAPLLVLGAGYWHVKRLLLDAVISKQEVLRELTAMQEQLFSLMDICDNKTKQTWASSGSLPAIVLDKLNGDEDYDSEQPLS